MFEDLNITPSLKLREKLSDNELDRICTIIKSRITRLTGEKPVASVVISAYNEEMYMLCMLMAMSHIQTQYPLEFIGVNNASSDRTGDIFKESGFTSIHESRKGLSYARQAGLEAAQGEFVFSSDADTVVPSTWIDGSLKYFNQNPNLVLLSGGIKPGIWPGSNKIYAMLRFYAGQFEARMKGKEKIVSYCGANTVYRRLEGLAAGGYEPGSDLGEDNIFAQRISTRGELLKVDNDPAIQVVTSGRRTATWGLIGKIIADRYKNIATGAGRLRKGMKLTDVR